MCLLAGFGANRAVTHAVPREDGAELVKSDPVAPGLPARAPGDFRGPSWLRDALDKWREQRAEVLIEQLLMPAGGPDDMDTFLENFWGTVRHSTSSLAKLGECEGEWEGEPWPAVYPYLGCLFVMTGWQVEPPSGSLGWGFGSVGVDPCGVVIGLHFDVAGATEARLLGLEGEEVASFEVSASPAYYMLTRAEYENLAAYGAGSLVLESETYPEGAVRGALLCGGGDLALCPVALTGAGLPYGAWASGAFVLAPESLSLLLSLSHNGLGDVDAVHIHAADATQTLALYEEDNDDLSNPFFRLIRPLEMAELAKQDHFGYVDLHTEQYGTADNFGQTCFAAGPAFLACPMTLTGDQVWPPSGCEETAHAAIMFYPDTMYFVLHIEHPFEEAQHPQGHLHGTDGGILVDFGELPPVFDHIMTEEELAWMDAGLSDYVDIHTDAFAPGPAVCGIPDCSGWNGEPPGVYEAGCALDFSLTLEPMEGLTLKSLGLRLQLPPQWRFVGQESGPVPGYSRQTGVLEESELWEFAWVTPPLLPATLVLRIVPPEVETATRWLWYSATYGAAGHIYYTGSDVLRLESEAGAEGEGETEGETVCTQYARSLHIEELPYIPPSQRGQAPPSEGEGEGEGEPCDSPEHSADTDGDHLINLGELLRVIQFFNSGGLHCADEPGDTEDGYVPGSGADHSCCAHDSDYYDEGADWEIGLTELLRVIQFFNSGGYVRDCNGTEDGYAPIFAPWDIRIPAALDEAAICKRERMFLEYKNQGELGVTLGRLASYAENGRQGVTLEPDDLSRLLMILCEMADAEVDRYVPSDDLVAYLDDIVYALTSLQISSGEYYGWFYDSTTNHNDTCDDIRYFRVVRHLLVVLTRHSCKLGAYFSDLEDILRKAIAPAAYRASYYASENVDEYLENDEMTFTERYLNLPTCAIGLGEYFEDEELDGEYQADLKANGSILLERLCNRVAATGIDEFLSPDYFAGGLEKLSLFHGLIRDETDHQRIEALMDNIWYYIAANWWEAPNGNTPDMECGGVKAMTGAHSRMNTFGRERGIVDFLRAYGWYNLAASESNPFPSAVWLEGFMTHYGWPQGPAYLPGVSPFREPIEPGEWREVRQSTGPGDDQYARNFITYDFSLGTAAHEFLEPHDITLSAYFLSHEAGAEALPGYAIMDAFDDPYGTAPGKKRLKNTLHFPGFVVSDQDKNQALYLVASQVYDDDTPWHEFCQPEEEGECVDYNTIRGNPSNHEFLRRQLNRCYGDFYKAEWAEGEWTDFDSTNFGNPEWSYTDYLATHFVFPWVGLSANNLPSTHWWNDDWFVYIGSGDNEELLDPYTFPNSGNPPKKYLNFVRNSLSQQSGGGNIDTVYLAHGDMFMAVRLLYATDMDGGSSYSVIAMREQMYPILDLPNNTGVDSPYSYEGYDFKSLEDDYPSLNGYWEAAAGDGDHYMTFPPTLPSPLNNLQVKLQARLRYPSGDGSLLVTPGTGDERPWASFNTDEISGIGPGLYDPATSAPPIFGGSAPMNMADLWHWEELEGAFTPSATPVKLEQDEPGVQIDAVRYKLADANVPAGGTINPRQNSYYRVRLSVIHHDERGQYKHIENGKAIASFFVMMGTKKDSPPGTPGLYANFAAFRAAFRDFADDCEHDVLSGTQHYFASPTMSIGFNAATLDRILPTSAKGSMNDPIEFRTSTQGTFAAPWGTDPGPFE